MVAFVHLTRSHRLKKDHSVPVMIDSGFFLRCCNAASICAAVWVGPGARGGRFIRLVKSLRVSGRSGQTACCSGPGGMSSQRERARQISSTRGMRACSWGEPVPASSCRGRTGSGPRSWSRTAARPVHCRRIGREPGMINRDHPVPPQNGQSRESRSTSARSR